MNTLTETRIGADRVMDVRAIRGRRELTKYAETIKPVAMTMAMNTVRKFIIQVSIHFFECQWVAIMFVFQLHLNQHPIPRP